MTLIYLFWIIVWLIATVYMIVIGIMSIINKKIKIFLKKLLIYSGFTFVPPALTIAYHYLTLYDDARVLLKNAMEYEKQDFNENIKKNKYDNIEKLKIDFQKEQDKLYLYCNKAIEEKKNNKHCRIYYTIPINFLDEFVDVSIEYIYDEESAEFYKIIPMGSYSMEYYMGYYDRVRFRYNEG